jgi:hypothetical protein
MTQEKFAELVNLGVCSASEPFTNCQDKLANEVMGSGVQAAVSARSSQGFMIILDRPAPFDVSFSWSALAVNGARTFEGQVAGDQTISITPTPTATPQYTPAPTEGITPTPTPIESVTPTPTLMVTPSVIPTEDLTPTPTP